jgi:hypothetical protein
MHAGPESSHHNAIFPASLRPSLADPKKLTLRPKDHFYRFYPSGGILMPTHSDWLSRKASPVVPVDRRILPAFDLSFPDNLTRKHRQPPENLTNT